MRAYLTYKSTGNVYGWYKVDGETQDEVNIILPQGATETETATNGRAIKMADGQIIKDIVTVRRHGACQPCIVDCAGDKPRYIYLKVQ